MSGGMLKISRQERLPVAEPFANLKTATFDMIDTFGPEHYSDFPCHNVSNYDSTTLMDVLEKFAASRELR
jgi:hypothetical protein